MPRTTLAVQVGTRDRITASARAASLTVDAFLVRVLDEREEQDFWASLEQLTPESYASATAQDDDDVDQGYEREDVLLDED